MGGNGTGEEKKILILFLMSGERAGGLFAGMCEVGQKVD